MTVESTPKRKRGGDTRLRLMEAATSVFARSGYERATIDEIVREAGFSKGAFYVHFESKEDVFWSMLEERIARQQAVLQSLDHGRSVAENVRTILNAVFGLVKDDPLWDSLFTEFVAHAYRNEKVRERLEAMYERWRGLTVQILDEGRQAGRIRADIDVQFIATIIMAVVEGSIIQARLAPEAVKLDEIVEPLTRTVAEWLQPG